MALFGINRLCYSLYHIAIGLFLTQIKNVSYQKITIYTYRRSLDPVSIFLRLTPLLCATLWRLFVSLLLPIHFCLDLFKGFGFPQCSEKWCVTVRPLRAQCDCFVAKGFILSLILSFECTCAGTCAGTENKSLVGRDCHPLKG